MFKVAIVFCKYVHMMAFFIPPVTFGLVLFVFLSPNINKITLTACKASQ